MTPRVIIIGPPGAGKSYVGAALARALACEFRDTDALIEAQAGEEISQIFFDKGEPYFRALEAEVLKSELAYDGAVLSLGGGAPLSESAQLALKSQSAPIVFLDVSLDIAAPRVGFNRARPLLLNNPRAQWQQLMDVRRPIYEALATRVVKVDKLSVADIVAAIEKELL